MFKLKPLFESLEKWEVRYLLCGGLAVNMYGIPRMTSDIDLLIDLTDHNVAVFEKALAENSYKPSIFLQLKNLIPNEFRLKMLKERNLVAYSFTSDSIQTFSLDVILDYPATFETCWARKEIRIFGGVNINLLSVDDLLKMKEKANRGQDKEDIFNLKKFFKK